MPVDYYIVLGVSRGANLNKIKKAYRKVAKKYHPDCAPDDPSCKKFREITEAYETLADEKKRREYDIALSKKERPAQPSGPPDEFVTPEELIRRRAPYEPIDSLFSRADEFFEGFVPGFIARERFRGPAKDLFIEAVLSPTEARNGGLFPLTVPVIENCPRCHKTGFSDDFFCPVCRGTGRVHGQRGISLSIPPNIRHGTRVSLSLEDIGLRNVNLNIIVHIDPFLEDYLW